MNLKGRYNMLRQAILAMVGVPDDNVESLKAMCHHLAIPSLTEADAVLSRLVLQTLVATHDGEPALPKHVAHVSGPMPKAAFDCILSTLGTPYPAPNGKHRLVIDFEAFDTGYAISRVEMSND